MTLSLLRSNIHSNAKLLVLCLIAVLGMIIARDTALGEASHKRHEKIMADLSSNITYIRLRKNIIEGKTDPTVALKQLLQFIETDDDK